MARNGLNCSLVHPGQVMECEIFLSILVRNLEPDVPLWHRVMILELYRTFCADSSLLRQACSCKLTFGEFRKFTSRYRSIFRSYDATGQSVQVFHEMIKAFSKIITTDGHGLLLSKTRSNQDSGPSGSPVSGNEEIPLAGASCSMRIPW